MSELMTESGLTKERIEHYRYVMHNNLPKNWMSAAQQTAAAIAQHKDKAAEIDSLCDLALRALSDHAEAGQPHVAWCRYVASARATRIVLCNSDDERAFKVYRAPAPRATEQAVDDRYKCRTCGEIMGGRAVYGSAWHKKDGQQCGPVDLRVAPAPSTSEPKEK